MLRVWGLGLRVEKFRVWGIGSVSEIQVQLGPSRRANRLLGYIVLPQ